MFEIGVDDNSGGILKARPRLKLVPASHTFSRRRRQVFLALVASMGLHVFNVDLKNCALHGHIESGGVDVLFDPLINSGGGVELDRFHVVSLHTVACATLSVTMEVELVGRRD